MNIDKETGLPIVDRDSIKDPFYKKILKTESHHNHVILQDGEQLRWKKNAEIDEQVRRVGLNEIWRALRAGELKPYLKRWDGSI